MTGMLRALHVGTVGGADCSSSSSSEEEDDLESVLRLPEAVLLHVRLQARVSCAWARLAHPCWISLSRYRLPARTTCHPFCVTPAWI